MAKGRPDKKGTALERSPSQLLHRALQLALDLYAEEFGRGALTQRQYAVLAAAADNEGATQTELVRVTGIDRSTLADMAARMMAKGLLQRERSASDARANAVRLTDLGHALLAEAAPRMATVDARLMKLLSGGRQRQALAGLLAELVGNGEARHDIAAARAAKKQAKKAKKAAKKQAVGSAAA